MDGMCKVFFSPSGGLPAAWRVGQQAFLAQLAVAEVTATRLTDLCSPVRGSAKTAFARQMAMYLCRMVFAMRLCDIALAFGRDRSTVAHALARIEEARENAEFDRRLHWLEAALQRAGGDHG
jgi:chromosomal replication initiation ATPase DnaA